MPPTRPAPNRRCPAGNAPRFLTAVLLGSLGATTATLPAQVLIKPVAVTTTIAGDAGSSAQFLLDDNPAHGPAGLQDADGQAVTLETGDPLSKALATYAYRAGDGQLESWTSPIGSGHPVFVLDLTGGGDTTIDSIVLWQYGNNGGSGSGNEGNSIREFELILHTASEGDTFDFTVETVEFSGTMDSIPGDAILDNVAQLFAFDAPVEARYVALRIASNYLDQPDVPVGGDRYGLGEVRFANHTDRDPWIDSPSSITLPTLTEDAPMPFDLTIENRGAGQELLVGGASVSGADASYFSVLTDLAEPLAIAPGDSTVVTFQFNPQGDERTFTAELLIESNDALTPTHVVPVTASLATPTDGEPVKAALLFVHAHADDETIFGGGVLPYYAQVRNLPVAVVSMVTRNPNGSNPITSGATSRVDELRRAMDVYAGQTIGSGTLDGSDYRTGNIVQAVQGLIDTGCCSAPPDDSWSDSGDGYGWGDSSAVSQVTPGFGNLDGFSDARLAARWAIARQIRRFRPEVIATCHDLEGDYGHSNHTATAIATIDAWSLAADAGTDIDGLAPWQAKKLYLRGGPDDNRDTISYTFNGPTFPSSFASDGGVNAMFHDFFEDPTIGGKTPRQVADLGLDEHASQGSPDVSTVFRSGENFESHHSEWWTLYRSELGPDDIKADFTIAGDTTGTTYSGWARGDFFDHLVVFPDRDEDGLPDDWELAYFGSRTAADPAADDDADGQVNSFEFIAGLDPGTPDRLRFGFTEDGSITFTVPEATGPGYAFLARHYTLHFSTDLLDWSTVAAAGVADGLPVSHLIGSAGESGPNGFYRLALSLRSPD